MADTPFLSHGGEMGAAMRARAWSDTPLGPTEGWPESLRTLVSLILAAAQPMFVLWGRERSLLYNDRYASLLGDKHPGALGQPFPRVWPEAGQALADVFDAAFSGEAVSIENVVLSLDRGGGGKTAHFAYALTPVRDDSEGVLGLFCTCLETTEAVSHGYAADLELRRLTEMFDQAPGFMSLLEGPEHRFRFANRAHRRLLGGREVIGRPVREALPELEAQGFVDLLDQVYASGQPFRGRGVAVQVAGRPGAAMEERILDFIYQPLTDEHGQVRGVFAEGSDVTDHVNIEAELRRSQDDLLLALEAGRFGAWTIDLQTMEYTNSAAHRRNFGRDPELPFTYEDMLAAIHPDDMLPRFAAVVQSIADSVNYDHEYRVLTPSGELRWVSLLGRTTYAPDGTPLKLSGVSSDITARKALDQDLRNLNEELERRVQARTDELLTAQASLRQAQKMEAVGQLTGGIAHDFNNLLMGISGSLELLQTRLAQGRMEVVPRYIESALAAVARAASLTQRLLAFSRRQTLDPRPVELNRLIAEMEDLIRRTVGPTITMDVAAAPDLWRTLVDPHQFENALLNLCINARDAMPDGGLLMIETQNRTVEAREARGWDLPVGDYTCLTVTDTGCGMTPEVVSRAFDPFFTTKPLGQGTGLGLSMIYGFVRQSGGEVRIHSDVGHGTTMCIYLPRFTGDAETGAAGVKPAGAVLEGHGEIVLVLDDEATVRMLISEVLQDAGYMTIEVEDGPSGMNVLQSDRRIDLLITDVGLPGGMNGRQVADAARVLRPDLKVLFVTGYAENAVVRNGRLEDGMQIITKPFTVSALGDKVRTLIEGEARLSRA